MKTSVHAHVWHIEHYCERRGQWEWSERNEIAEGHPLANALRLLRRARDRNPHRAFRVRSYVNGDSTVITL